MPNLSLVLKQEIARIARKEQRAEVAALQKASAAQRRAIAALRRQVAVLERQLRLQARGTGHRASAPEAGADASGPTLRFSAKGLAAQRERLGLSAASVATILGVSALSVYNWESGKARPRARQLEAIARLRKMGKREARAMLEAADPASGKQRRSKAA